MNEGVRSLDRISIPNPCDADWESMIGNDQVRFCRHCNLQVTNLSSLTRHEAMRLVAQSKGRLCARYVQQPDGRVLTKTIPGTLHHIGGRVSRIAAGAFSATLSISAVTAQTASKLSADAAQIPQKLTPEKSESSNADSELSGRVTDPNYAVIAGATVTLITLDGNTEVNTTSSDQGEYLFQNIAPGNYSLRITSPGFRSYELTSITVTANSTSRFDAALEVGIALGGAVVFIAPEEPLVKAAFDEDVDAVNRLAFASLDLNVRDRNTNLTALEQAVETGNLEIVRILLRAGANINTKNQSGRTALMLLRDNASVELVRELLSAGAKFNAVDDTGTSALMNAAAYCKYEVVKELIEAGAKFNQQDADGNTALLLGATNDDPRVTKLLLDFGADVNAQDHNGKTALMTAADEGDPQSVKYLIAFNADVNDKDDDGWTALMYAAKTTDAESLTALLNAGADVTVKDRDGKTALAIARENDHGEIAKLLESRGAPE